MKTYAKETPEIRLRKKNGQMLTAQIKTSKDAAIYFREIFDAYQLEVREQAMAILPCKHWRNDSHGNRPPHHF